VTVECAWCWLGSFSRIFRVRFLLHKVSVASALHSQHHSTNTPYSFICWQNDGGLTVGTSHTAISPELPSSNHKREHKSDRQCTYDVTLRHVRQCCSGKSVSVTYCECAFESLGIRHAMRIRHIVICALPGCTIFFLYYLINGAISKKKLLNIKCLF
jgi:hypothetical protein